MQVFVDQYIYASICLIHIQYLNIDTVLFTQYPCSKRKLNHFVSILQAEKLAHADLLLKDLWLENGKLMAALNATEQRVIQLENLLKFQMSTTNTSSGNMSASNNILTTNAASVIPSSQHSLPHSYNYFSS